LNIRLANHKDLEAITQVYRTSIQVLCAKDYDQDVIELWQSSSTALSRMHLVNEGKLWVVDAFSRTDFYLDSNHNETKVTSLTQDELTPLAGFMVVTPGELVSLFIHPDYARLGVGKKLAQMGIQMAKKGCTSIRLESTLTALSFYQKLGFVEQSRGYFSHGRSDLKIPVVNMTLTF